LFGWASPDCSKHLSAPPHGHATKTPVTELMPDPEFRFEISLSVLNHLGRNLYRNFITVLGEAISNSWDADAKNVWIDFDKDDLVADEYPLENLNFELIGERNADHEKGTIIVFEETKEVIRNSEAHIKKLLAMSFKFSLLDEAFNIHINGDQVTIGDLKDLMDATEFLWLINGYDDEYIQGLANLKAEAKAITAALDVKGFIGTVIKPRDLKITGTDERATIDLFVNGRLREKNIIRHIPTQRIVESYIYGQIHFDAMDQGGSDPFTSSREGIVDDDENFKALLVFLKGEVLPKILDEWDALRLDRGEEGDDENERKSRRERKARDLYSAVSDEFKFADDAPGKEQAEGWVVDLRGDAEFNISSYVDCFLSENLVRKFIDEHKLGLTEPAQKEADEFRDREEQRKKEAGISFDVRRDQEDIGYLGMDALALSVEKTKRTDEGPTLWTHAVNFRPVRNAVGHTGLLSDAAKKHLSVTFENIKARVINLISNKNDE
jgi:hypothetical protein